MKNPDQTGDGGDMQIQYINPLKNGFAHMKKALFKPFELRLWLVIGFTAFLAQLTEWGGGGNSGISNKGNHDFNLGDVVNAPGNAINWLTENPGWFIFIIFVAFIIIALAVVLTWLSARGKFMFLHNVAHYQSEVSKPWHEYRKEGNSLFLWLLGFGFISFLFICLDIVLLYGILSNIYWSDPPVSVIVFNFIGLGLLFLLTVIIISFIERFLNDFVVPIMFKHRISCIDAWGRYWTILKKHFFSFILYGLFYFLIAIVIGMAVIAAGLLTCCIGFLFFALPYVNSVVLLPVSYTLRAFSLEFLAQFGKEVSLLPKLVKKTA